MSDGLNITAARIEPPAPVAADDAARGVQERLQLALDVQNDGDAPLHVWTSRTSYDYDPETKTLSVRLAAPEEVVPPEVELISDHPRVPVQTVVEPGGAKTIEVPIPTTIRRRVPGEGLGMSVVDEPIGDIDRVEAHVQHSDVPLQAVIGESPADLRDRLKAHGDITVATLPVNPSPE